MYAALAAIPVNPNTAAIIAMTKKETDHESITPPFDFQTFHSNVNNIEYRFLMKKEQSG